MSEQKKSGLPIAAIAGAIVVAGGAAGAYFYFSKSGGIPGLGNKPAAVIGSASLVPKQALMAVSISTDGEAYKQLQTLLSAESKAIVEDGISQVKKSLATSDLDFDKDVQPWLGKSMTIAILPSAKKGANLPFAPDSGSLRYVPMSSNGMIAQAEPADKPAEAPTTAPKAEDKSAAPKGDDPKATEATPPDAKPKEGNPPAAIPPEGNEPPAVSPGAATAPNLVIVVEVKDKEAANKFIEKAKSKAKGTPKVSKYKDIEITQYGAGRAETVSALVGNYWVVAPQEKSVQDAIDTFQGGASLATELAADDLQMKNSLFQIYIPNAAENLPQLSEINPNGVPLTPEAKQQIQKLKSINFGVGVDDAGVRFKLSVRSNGDDLKNTAKNENKIIAQLPAQTFAVITGTNLKDYWTRFAAAPEVSQNVDEVRSQLKGSPLAIDLDKDIFGWMDGEFALGAIAAKPEGILTQTQGLAPVLMIQTSNRSQAEALFKKLDDFVGKNGGKVDKKDNGGVPVVEWNAPGTPGALLSYGWHQKDTMFITLPPASSLFVPKPASGLDADPKFKAATGSLPTNTIGYFYVDMEKAISIAQATTPPDKKVPPQLLTLLKNVQGIGVTASTPGQGVASVEMLLALKPAAK
ncbi:MAG: DUF3352 domain-containing protein [Pseudanabaenaceae cyanobacterium]|jgi:hypothetical protein